MVESESPESPKVRSPQRFYSVKPKAQRLKLKDITESESPESPKVRSPQRFYSIKPKAQSLKTKA